MKFINPGKVEVMLIFILLFSIYNFIFQMKFINQVNKQTRHENEFY